MNTFCGKKVVFIKVLKKGDSILAISQIIKHTQKKLAYLEVYLKLVMCKRLLAIADLNEKKTLIVKF